MVDKARQLRPQRTRVPRGAPGQGTLLRSKDVGTHPVEKKWSLLLAQCMTRSEVHLLVARPGVDSKQLIHQRYRTHRHGILLVEFHRIHKFLRAFAQQAA